MRKKNNKNSEVRNDDNWLQREKNDIKLFIAFVSLGGCDQKHFLWTMYGPDSSYSAFAIHICKFKTYLCNNLSQIIHINTNNGL